MEKLFEILSFVLLKKMMSWQDITGWAKDIRQQMEEWQAPLLRDFQEILEKVYLYEQPIKRDTKVIEGIVLDREFNIDNDYDLKIFGEDGVMYYDTDDCVCGKDRDEVQRILDELRDDMEISGDFD